MAGVISRGIQGPIIREGDDIVDIVVKSVYASEQADGYTLQNRDVIAVTESVVARAQGNYVTVDQVAQDIRAKWSCSATPTTRWATPSWSVRPI